MQRMSSILVVALLAIMVTVPGNVVLGEASQEMEKVLVPCYQPPGPDKVVGCRLGFLLLQLPSMSPSVLNIKMDVKPEGFVYYNPGNVNDTAFD